jgi:hypothetical protein
MNCLYSTCRFTLIPDGWSATLTLGDSGGTVAGVANPVCQHPILCINRFAGQAREVCALTSHNRGR